MPTTSVNYPEQGMGNQDMVKEGLFMSAGVLPTYSSDKTPFIKFAFLMVEKRDV